MKSLFTVMLVTVIAIMAGMFSLNAHAQFQGYCHNPKTGAVIPTKPPFHRCPYGWEKV